MNIIVSFSGRRDGNCDAIAKYISSKGDLVLFMRDICTQPCAGCDYECMSDSCKYHGDGIYTFFDKCYLADKIFFTPFSELCTHGKRAYKYTLQAVDIHFIIK